MIFNRPPKAESQKHHHRQNNGTGKAERDKERIVTGQGPKDIGLGDPHLLQALVLHPHIISQPDELIGLQLHW